MAVFEPKPFGKYFLTERLAIGGMAEIYKAKTFGVDGFEKLLAIKKILPHYSADREFIAMLTDEAKLVVRLSHTNIVQIYDLGKVGDDYYISMEFIDGLNLRELISRGKELKEKIPLPICIYIISEISKGLDYAHSKRDDEGSPLNIVHRDISPQNILISFEGETKIVDFGIAKAAMNVSHTSSGILKGKITYMSPEQALGKPVDSRTDIFSTGLILYELVTGERLFSGETQFEVLKKIRTTQIGETTLDPIPQLIRPVLSKTLAYQIKNRFETAGDLQVALTKLLYSEYNDFSPRQLAQLIKKWFAPELKIKKRRQATEPSVDFHTQSLMINPPDQKSILAVDPQAETGTFLQDTTKPESKILPKDLRHGGEESPTHKSRKTRRKQIAIPKKFWPLAAGIAALLLIGGGIYKWASRPEPPPPPIVDVDDTPTDDDIPPPPLPPTVDKVSAQISSAPDGAEIFLDGNPTGKKTPAVLEGLEIGNTYIVSLQKEKYLPVEKELTPIKDQPLSFEAKLEKEIFYSAIELESNPPGALIFLDGKNMGLLTPAKIDDLEIPKTYQIRLQKEKYEEKTLTAELSSENPLKLVAELKLKPEFLVAHIKVSSNVASAQISVNGQVMGAVGETLEVAPGEITVTLSKKGYQKGETKITLTGGEERKIAINLVKVEEPIQSKPPPIVVPPPPITVVGGVGELRVDSKPRGAGVMVNGARAGITPVVVSRLDRGKSHTVVLSLPGYKSWSKTVKLGAGRLELSAQMERE